MSSSVRELQRAYRAVARRFAVSDTAVRKHALKEDWKRCAKRHDAETTRRIEREMVRSRAERIADVIRLADASPRHLLCQRRPRSRARYEVAIYPGSIIVYKMGQPDNPVYVTPRR
jgi:hypothetical protein